MAKRISILIDDNLDKELRMIQAKMIQKENKSISYSHVVNLSLKKGLRK